MINLTPFLEDLERRINEEEESAIYEAWKNFAFGTNDDQGTFTPPCRTPHASALEWKHVNINDAIEDEDLMIYSQLENINRSLSRSGNMVLQVRPNYGVGIISSMFGAKTFIMPREMDTLPNVYALEGGDDAIRRIVDGPARKLTEGHASHVFSVGEKFAEIREKYPKIGRYVRFDNPDAQGPIDNCELLWGSENMFLAIYDEPELLHSFMSYLTSTIISFMRKWFTYISYDDGMTNYFGRIARGNIVIRNDSSMNLSPDSYKEFVQPYDIQVLQALGGGGIHFCGTGDHFVELLAQAPLLSTVDISQPHLNNMEKILTAIPDQGINLFCPRGDFSVEGHEKKRIFLY